MIRTSQICIYNILVAFCLSNLPAISFAEESIHFGSIFSEDNSYRTEESREKINQLTENSAQQKTLEELYPEFREQNARFREVPAGRSPDQTKSPNNSPTIFAPRSSGQPVILNKPAPAPTAPAQAPSYSDSSRLGVVTNNELDRHVVYFIELRPIAGNVPRDLYTAPNTLNKPAARIEPGELIKVVDSSEEYIQKMRMDRDNQGLWRKVARQRDHDPIDLFVYYDWKNFDTVSPAQSALEMDILVPRDMSSVPVFSKPGPWTWKDCQIGVDVCLDRIDQHVEAFLLDTGFALVNDLRTRQSSLQLFYKIGYRIYDKEGQLRHKIGWIPSYFARRKISVLPKNLLSTNEYGFSGFETDEERISRLAKYYVFHENLFSENRLFSRWLKRSPGEKTEVFDNNFEFDMLLAYSTFDLKQSFLSAPFKQTGVTGGIGVYAPLYVDLEVQATFAVTMPIKAEPANLYTTTPIFRGDQWLMYTSPVGINKLPVKFGFGLYYLTMFESTSNFGFKSFVGFQSKIAVENEHFWFDVRYGPTGQDFNFEMTNAEVGSSLGIRLDPTRSYDSLTLFLDYSSTHFKSPATGHTTDYNIFNLGFRKTF